MVALWFFYILGAVAIWGINLIIDKIILSKNKISSLSYLIFFIPAKLSLILILLFLFPIFPLTATNLPFIIFALLSGISGVLGYLFYAFAVKREEISRVGALVSIYPIFVAILAAIFLSEIFTPEKYFGIALVVAGATLIGYKRASFWKVLPFIAFAVVMLVNLFWGLEGIFDKLAFLVIDVPTGLVYYMIGNILTQIPILASTSLRKQTITDFRKLKKNTVFLMIFDTVIWVLATILSAFAIYFGPVTLVSTVAVTLPLVTLVYAFAVSKFYPKILKEEITTTSFLLKLISVLLIIFGTYLII